MDAYICECSRLRINHISTTTQPRVGHPGAGPIPR